MDRRCETCKWWSKWSGPYGHCGYPDDSDTIPPKEIGERKAVIVHEVGSFSADLFTAPDFGCVQWEADK